MGRYYLASAICAVFIVNCVSSIHYRNDGIKTKSFHVDPQLADRLPRRPVEMHHQYSRVVSNRPTSEYTVQLNHNNDATRGYQGSTTVYQSNQGNAERQGRAPYGFAVENGISTYLTECPPNATGQFAYLYDCRRFLNCWKGRGFIQSCGPGTVFNPDTLECDSPKKVECNHGSSKYGSSSGVSAQYTNTYNKPISRTVYTSEVNSDEIKCTPGFTGMEPHPYDCSKFLNCGNGITHIQNCGPGTFFNPSSKVCDISTNVECRRGARLVHQLPSVPREIAPISSGNGAIKCSPGAAGVEAHPHDCAKFLNCANGITYIQNCGPGTVFNAAMKVCDFPYKVNCGSRSIAVDSSGSGSTTHYEVRRPVGPAQTNFNHTVYQSQNSGGNGYNENRGSHYHRHGHQHTHQHVHTADCQHNHRHFIHETTPGWQQYNWTVTRAEQPLPNNQYNWTRTISSYPVGTQQHNWTATQANTGGWTEASSPPRYPANTQSTNYNWPHQSTGHRVDSTQSHQSTNYNWPHQHHVHTPQPVLNTGNGEWSNPSTVDQSVFVPTHGHPQQTTETRRVQYWFPQYPPPNYSGNSPNPQNNFGIPQNPNGNGLSRNVTIYYAYPAQNSERGVVVQQTNPPFSEPPYHIPPNGNTLDSVPSSSVGHNVVYRINSVTTTDKLNANNPPVPLPSGQLLPPHAPTIPTNNPNLPRSNSGRDVVYTITSESRSQTIGPNNSYVPLPPNYLLPPLLESAPIPPKSEIPSGRDIVYRITSESRTETIGPNNSFVPIPPTHLLPPYSETAPIPPKSEIPSGRDIVYRITSESRTQTISPNNSFVPIPPTHLLPPYSETAPTKPNPEPPKAPEHRVTTTTSSDYDSNLYGGLLPPYPDALPPPPPKNKPSVYLLPLYPPLANESDSVSSPSEPKPNKESPQRPATRTFSHTDWILRGGESIPPKIPSTFDTQRTTILTQSEISKTSTTERTVDTDSSISTNIYYAVPVEDSEELFEHIYGGDISPNPDSNGYNQQKPAIKGSKDKSESSKNPDGSLSTASSKINITTFDESNLYGGLLPPYLPNSTTTTPKQTEKVGVPLGTTKTNVRMFTIHPSKQNATFEEIARNFSLNPPIYSPSYSSISHTRNWSQSNPEVEVISPINAWLHSSNRSVIANPINVTVTRVVSTQFGDSPPVVETSVVEYPPEMKVIPLKRPTSTEAIFTPTFNREYYKQSEQGNSPKSDTDEMSNLPISEAIKALLKPYLNRSGTVSDDDLKKADSFIMSLTKSKQDNVKSENEKPKVPGTNDKELQTDKTKVNVKEVELILAGEQDNLSEGVWGKHHTHSHPHGHWHSNSEFHSREFHRNHPHIRNPFSNPHSGTPSLPPDTETIPAPDLQGSATSFQTTTPTYFPGIKSDREFVDYGQATIPLDQNPTEESHSEGDFDCGNGKFVKKFEVCDGVNNCGNRADEESCQHLGFEVRLSNEDGSKHMGRVEVKVLGKWGYVCDDKFGMRDADVLCRELGFPLGASEVRANSYYPPHVEMMTPTGDVLFVMDEIDCRGNETSIKECDFKGWGVHDCTADEVVGVVCKLPVMKCSNDYWLCNSSKECIPPAFVCDNVADCTDGSDESPSICNSQIEYRLADGDSKIEGRVEVKYHGSWGTICDDDFGQNEASVVCRSLGFNGGATILKNLFGPGTGPIWLDQVFCTGNETSIAECNHWAWGEHNCNHTEDISISCSTGIGRPPFLTGVKGSKTNPMNQPNFEESFEEEDENFSYSMERSSKILKEHKNCGIVKNVTDEFYASEERLQRVVHGSSARRGHHPWQATIRTRGLSGKSTHWCGAVLISDRHLLTAAHCLAGYGKGAYFVRLGDHYANVAEASEVDVNIENWYIHESFRKGTHMNNDIALVVLKRPVRLTDYVQPICLPERNADYSAGKMCVISGWGSIQSGISTPANNLRAAEIPIISEDVCKQPHVYGNAITEGMFCAGYLDESVDACDGDSGGPLVCTSNNELKTLYGIISWGQHCGYANKPGVYVKIAKYIDWIYGKLGLTTSSAGDIR